MLCLLRASPRPRQDKIKSIRLSRSSSCFSDSKATGRPCVRWSRRACVWSCVCVCVRAWARAGVWHSGKDSAASLSCKLILIRGKIKCVLHWDSILFSVSIRKFENDFPIFFRISLRNKVDGALVIAQRWRPRDDLGFSQCFYSTNGR